MACVEGFLSCFDFLLAISLSSLVRTSTRSILRAYIVSTWLVELGEVASSLLETFLFLFFLSLRLSQHLSSGQGAAVDFWCIFIDRPLEVLRTSRIFDAPSQYACVVAAYQITSFLVAVPLHLFLVRRNDKCVWPFSFQNFFGSTSSLNAEILMTGFRRAISLIFLAPLKEEYMFRYILLHVVLNRLRDDHADASTKNNLCIDRKTFTTSSEAPLRERHKARNKVQDLDEGPRGAAPGVSLKRKNNIRVSGQNGGSSKSPKKSMKNDRYSCGLNGRFHQVQRLYYCDYVGDIISACMSTVLFAAVHFLGARTSSSSMPSGSWAKPLAYVLLQVVSAIFFGAFSSLLTISTSSLCIGNLHISSSLLLHVCNNLIASLVPVEGPHSLQNHIITILPAKTGLKCSCSSLLLVVQLMQGLFVSAVLSVQEWNVISKFRKSSMMSMGSESVY